MQLLPLLTPVNFTNNEKKRTRPDDDFESNCLKKRLISTCAPTTPPQEFDEYDVDNNDKVGYIRGRVTPPPYFDQVPDHHYSKNKTILDTNLNNFLEVNGFNNHIPGFVLNPRSFQQQQDKEAQSQLVLYKPNPLLLPPLSPPTTPTITEIDDEEEEDFEPMDLD